MSSRYFDVIVVTDARLVGGGNKSLAQEVRAHARAGYRTGLLSLSGPARGGGRPIDTSLMHLIREGLLTMVRPDQHVEAGLVIARGPSMFEVDQPFVPKIRAQKWLLVANAFNTDPRVSGMLYNPVRVQQRAAELFDHPWTWVPLSPVVRMNMLASHPKLELSADTWSNIIRTDDWWVDRPANLDHPIRLGRHSRDAPGKWPTSQHEIREAYPDDSNFSVSVMGGGKTPRKILGSLPENWRVLPFGAMSPQEFLRDIDVYPYFHHPEMKEAFGRSVLEAIASGSIAILPPYFESIYSDAAIYAEPADVKGIADELFNDPASLKLQRERSRDVLEEKFSHSSHVQRLRSLIGAPRPGMSVMREDKPPLPADLSIAEPERSRVLFYTDNGHGLGHVTRLMAYAKRLAEDVQPFFLTMSEAYHLVHEQGFPVEYFPSAKKMSLTGKERPLWEEIFKRRMRLTLERVKPAVVVVDHVNPPAAIRELRAEHPEVVFVWSRRGLWRQHRKPAGLWMADGFDYVLEPMDLAAAVDMGFTPRLSAGTAYVPPVTLLERHELMPRSEARRALGLPESGTVVLLNLSADSTEGLVSLIRRVKNLLHKYAPEGEEATIFAPIHALHAAGIGEIDDVVMRDVYPVAKYANAFDAAISTAGYNSFHELVYLGVPAVYVARATQTLDDQYRRASFAALGGFGSSAQSVESLEFESSVKQIMSESMRRRMRAAAGAAFPTNGASEAASLIRRLAQRESLARTTGQEGSTVVGGDRPQDPDSDVLSSRIVEHSDEIKPLEGLRSGLRRGLQ